MMKWLTRFRKSQRGTSLVEFSIVLPLLFLLSAGIFEFGTLLYDFHLINTGIHDAARFLAHTNDPASSETAAAQLAVYGQVGGSVKRVSWWKTTDIKFTLTPVANANGAYRGPNPFYIVTVATTAKDPGVGFLNYLGLGGSITFTLQHEERVVGN